MFRNQLWGVERMDWLGACTTLKPFEPSIVRPMREGHSLAPATQKKGSMIQSHPGKTVVILSP